MNEQKINQMLRNQKAILNGLLFCVPQGIEYDELWEKSKETEELLNIQESNTEQKIKDALEEKE